MAKILCFSVLLLAFAASSSNACECGLEGSATRIFKGKQARDHKYPWLVHIRTYFDRIKGSYGQCGGALVGHRHVLTAAHCVVTDGVVSPARNIDVFLGRKKAFSERSSPELVVKVWVDPAYNPDTLANDFAILTLYRSVPYSNKVSPVCLPTSEDNLDKLTVTGWGMTSATADSSNDLLEVEVDYIPRNECNDMQANYLLKEMGVPLSYKHRVRGLPKIAETHMCALNKKTGGDACSGDSGGPIMKQGNDGRWYLMGVVSGAIAACGTSSDVPGLYSRIASYRNIIQKTVPDACWRSF